MAAIWIPHRRKFRIVMKGFRSAIVLVLRFGFGSLLIYASVNKIINPIAFAYDIENYRIAGSFLSRLAAVWLPYVEMSVGLMMITGIWLETALYMNMFLMWVFLIMVLQAYIRGLDIVCGCFSNESKVDAVKILENIFLALSGTGLVWLRTRSDVKH